MSSSEIGPIDRIYMLVRMVVGRPEKKERKMALKTCTYHDTYTHYFHQLSPTT